MGWLQTLINRLRVLLPGTGTTETDAEVGVPAERAYECAVCGTPIPPDAEACPLCRSTDLVPAGEPSTPSSDEVRLQGGEPRETVAGDDGVTIGEVLGDDGDLLAAYAEEWERVSDAYLVELGDGTTRRVDTKDEVRAVLYDEYGPPDP